MNYHQLGMEILGAAPAAAVPVKSVVRKPVTTAVPVATAPPKTPPATPPASPPAFNTNAASPPKKVPGTTAPIVNTKLAQRLIASGQSAIAAGRRLSGKGFRGLSAAAIAAGQRSVDAGKKAQAQSVRGDADADPDERARRNALAFSDAYTAAEPVINALKAAVDSLASKTDEALVNLYNEGTSLLHDFDRVGGPEFLEQFAELKPKATDLTSRIAAATGSTTPPPPADTGGGGGGGGGDTFPPDDTSEAPSGDAAFEPPGSMTDAASAAASAAVNALKAKTTANATPEAPEHTEASLMPSLSTTSLIAGAACLGAAFFLWRKYRR